MLLGAAFCALLSCLSASASAHTLNATAAASSSSSIQAASSTKDATTSPSSQPVPTSSASSSKPVSTSSSSSSKPGVKNPKRGIAFASGGTPDDILNANQTKSVISWIYDWANLPPAYIAQSGLKYIPMQWGSGSIDRFQDAVSAENADTILAFNEPDFVNEANMKATDAAQLWMQFIQPLKQRGVKLGGPAVTAAPTGKQWLSDFFAACKNCSVDFLPLHWYGSGTEGFYNYIWDIHTNFPQYPIWITEYADVSENATVVWDFMNQTINYLDSLEWIERYSWFGFFRPEKDVFYNMLSEDGGLNELGELYTGAKTVHTSNRTTSSAQYKTVSPSDDPNQPLVTSWPAVSAATAAVNFSWSQGHIFIASLVFGALASLV